MILFYRSRDKKKYTLQQVKAPTHLFIYRSDELSVSDTKGNAAKAVYDSP